MSEGNNGGGSGLGSVIAGIASILVGLLIPIGGIIVGVCGIAMSSKATDPGMATSGKVLSILGLVVSVGNWVLGTMMIMSEM